MYTATHCNNASIYCNTLQQDCNSLCSTHALLIWRQRLRARCIHTATCCNTMQHPATMLQYIVLDTCPPHMPVSTLCSVHTHFNKLQHTATRLQHTQHAASHCSRLQDAAAHSASSVIMWRVMMWRDWSTCAMLWIEWCLCYYVMKWKYYNEIEMLHNKILIQ